MHNIIHHCVKHVILVCVIYEISFCILFSTVSLTIFIIIHIHEKEIYFYKDIGMNFLPSKIVKDTYPDVTLLISSQSDKCTFPEFNRA
jgi:hypothetical protein